MSTQLSSLGALRSRKRKRVDGVERDDAEKENDSGFSNVDLLQPIPCSMPSPNDDDDLLASNQSEDDPSPSSPPQKRRRVSRRSSSRRNHNQKRPMSNESYVLSLHCPLL